MNNKELIGKRVLFNKNECCILLGLGTYTGIDRDSKIGTNSIFIVGDTDTTYPSIGLPRLNIKELYGLYTNIREGDNFLMITVIGYDEFVRVYEASPFKAVSWGYADEFQPINDKSGLLTYTKTLYI